MIPNGSMGIPNGSAISQLSRARESSRIVTTVLNYILVSIGE
ncbi:hypothetical protein F383_16158 [Gossypium arboreum]|uniref:Uncharacterized protein n=1 Tax=Gossypium arboreum TaxID=29729 RepID=A0A0B0PYA9_GOSAR|nr:hypothetical protein F383_16158 [Gossypium arboreum]